MSKLEDILLKQAKSSHAKWMMDTCERYERAGLWPPDVASAMTTVLISALAAVWATGNIDKPGEDEKLFKALKMMIEAQKKVVRAIDRDLDRDHVNGH